MRTEGYDSPAEATFVPRAAALQDLTYQYDLGGNVIRIVDRTPGAGVRNNPDAANVPEFAVDLAAGDALVRSFGYDAAYRLVSATGRECDRIVSPVPVAEVPWPQPAASRCGSFPAAPDQDNAKDVTALYEEQYEYDPAGNLTALRHRRRSGTPPAGASWVRRFGHGGLSPDLWAQEWVTRLASHLQGKRWTAPRSNRATNVGEDGAANAPTYAYDSSGNLTDETSSRHFEWDHADRLRRFYVDDGAGGVSQEARYFYDAGGQRVVKFVRTAGGRAEVTVYSDAVFEQARWDVGRATEASNTRLHLMDNQRRIASRRAGPRHPDEAGPDIEFQFADHLNSSALVMGGGAVSTATFMNREEFFPYGETSFGSFARKRFRFTGMERDESGLGYHGARYYAPWLARWIGCDPLGMRDSPSLYAYGRGSPLRYTDIGGLATVEVAATSSGGTAPSAASLSTTETTGGWLSDLTPFRSPARSANLGPAEAGGASWQFDLTPYRPARSAGFGVAAETRGLTLLEGLGDGLAVLGDLATVYTFIEYGLFEMRFQEEKYALEVEQSERLKLSAWVATNPDLLGMRRMPDGDFGNLTYDYTRNLCRFTRVRMPKASVQSTSETATPVEAGARYKEKPKYTKGQIKTPECADDILEQLHNQKNEACNQERACNPQLDDCATIQTKISAGYACISTRERIQQCFEKMNPEYEAHMNEIANGWKTLRACLALQDLKCP